MEDWLGLLKENDMLKKENEKLKKEIEALRDVIEDICFETNIDSSYFLPESEAD